MTYELAIQQQCDEAQKAQHEKIMAVIKSLPFIWVGDKKVIQVDKDELIELVRNA